MTKLMELRDILADVIKGSGKPVWKKLFDRMAPYFKTRLSWSSSEEARIREEIEEIVKKDKVE